MLKHFWNQEIGVDRPMLLKVHHMLKAFMLWRIKADVEKTVPPKVERQVLCSLTSVLSYWYKQFLLTDSSLLIQLEFEKARRPLRVPRQLRRKVGGVGCRCCLCN